MAFTDALIDHAEDVHVTIVDRRSAAGGHWLDAYPFVRLHQASVFYGVASTILGDGSLQQDGPEAGLQERADQPEIVSYFDDILQRRFIRGGRVTFLPRSEHRLEG
ncbi:MAG: pyridine nucleotide-disulfide oxidoreductase, partial [Actinomycetota bacterium]